MGGVSREAVHVRFYAQLGEFLPSRRRGRGFLHPLRERTSVKDLLESLGPPHTEVELVLVDGRPVGLGHVLEGGERLAAYPTFRQLDVRSLRCAGPPLARDGRFLLDGHLGRLAAYLRLCGLDAAHEQAADDPDLARTSYREGRTLLTRDVGLLKRSLVERGYFVRATRPRAQLEEVLDRFDLRDVARPFTRCMRCNGAIRAADAAEVADRVPPRAHRDQVEFRVCTGCGRVYWKGTHYERMQALLEAVGVRGCTRS